MYVRIRKTRLKSGDVTLRADVMRAFRNPMTDVPTSALVASLATIRKSELSTPARLQKFWHEVGYNLRRLGLSEDEESKIREAVRRRIPRPAHHAGSLSRAGGLQSRRATMTTKLSTDASDQSVEELLYALKVRLGID